AALPAGSRSPARAVPQWRAVRSLSGRPGLALPCDFLLSWFRCDQIHAGMDSMPPRKKGGLQTRSAPRVRKRPDFPARIVSEIGKREVREVESAVFLRTENMERNAPGTSLTSLTSLCVRRHGFTHGFLSLIEAAFVVKITVF